MTTVVTISGSPADFSRSWLLAGHVSSRLAQAGFTTRTLNVRDLPAEDLVRGRVDAPAVREAVGVLEAAQGVVITTPVYKASFTGILKSFLDLLPQFGLTGKVVLPLATGGTLAHVLAIDFGLRPVLASLGALHVVNGLFLLDSLLQRTEGGLLIDAELGRRLDRVVDDFGQAVLRAHLPLVSTPSPEAPLALV